MAASPAICSKSRQWQIYETDSGTKSGSDTVGLTSRAAKVYLSPGVGLRELGTGGIVAPPSQDLKIHKPSSCFDRPDPTVNKDRCNTELKLTADSR